MQGSLARIVCKNVVVVVVVGGGARWEQGTTGSTKIDRPKHALSY